MLRQNHSDGLPADFVDDSASDCVVRQQANRPSRSALGRRAAYQGHDRRLLAAVQLWLVAMIQARLFAECVLETALLVAPGDAGNLAPVRAHGLCRRGQGHAPVQHQQRLDPSPDPCRPLLACSVPSP
jgi:hypothetical protein